MLSKLVFLFVVSVQLVAVTGNNATNGTNVTTTTTTTADDVFIASTTTEAATTTTTTAQVQTQASTTTTTTPAGQVTKTVISGALAISLPAGVTAADFVADPKVKTAMQESVAEVAGVDKAWVEITKLEVATSRRLLERRLAGSSINVEYKITVPTGETAPDVSTVASKGATFVTKINTKLSAAGSSYTIASCVPSTPVVETVIVTTTTTTAASGTTTVAAVTTVAPTTVPPASTSGAAQVSCLVALMATVFTTRAA